MFLETMGRGGGGGGRPDKFILRGHTPVPCYDLMEWARWFQTADRSVGFTPVHGVNVSTVFLGLDHAFYGGPPLLFETMIFGGGEDGWQMRGSTWAEAELQHRTGIAVARRASRKPDAKTRRKAQLVAFKAAVEEMRARGILPPREEAA